MIRRFFGLAIASVFAVAVAACTPKEIATATSDIAVAKATLDDAITLWGIADGLASVAVTADPALGPVILPVLAAVEPIVATAKTIATDAAAAAPQLLALAQQIQTQANTLTRTAAPAIQAIPAAPE